MSFLASSKSESSMSYFQSLVDWGKFSRPFLRTFDFISLSPSSSRAIFNHIFSLEGICFRPSISTFLDSSCLSTRDNYIQTSSLFGTYSRAFLKIARHSVIFPSSSSILAAESQMSGFLGLEFKADLCKSLARLISPSISSSILEVSRWVRYPTLSTIDFPLT